MKKNDVLMKKTHKEDRKMCQ